MALYVLTIKSMGIIENDVEFNLKKKTNIVVSK